MESRPQFEEVDFQKYWLTLKRRWLASAGVFGIVILAAAVLTSLQEPIYEARGRLLFRTNRTSALTGLGEDLGRLEALDLQNNPLDTQAEIVRSTAITQEAIDALDLRDDEGNPLKPEVLAEGLKVKSVPGTDILEIAYQDPDPRLAADVVNQVVEAFIQNNVMSNRAEAAAVREFIAEQLPRTEEAVRNAELALRQFKEENRIISLQEEAIASVGVISDLERQIAQSRSQLADANARVSALQARVGMDAATAIDMAALSQSSGIQEVLAEYQQVQSQLAGERSRYQSQHPTIMNLERREASLRQLLQSRVADNLGRSQVIPEGSLQLGQLREQLTADFVRSEVELRGLADQTNYLTSAQTAYRERASLIPRLEQAQRELERRVEAAQSTYETLLTKLQEVQVAENQNIGNARMIASALVPEQPVGPRRGLNLAAGGVAGLLLAIATAFLLDTTDRSLKTVKEARERLGYTLLGIIPAFGKSNRNLRLVGHSDRTVPRVLARDMPYSPIRDAYQMLQANLKFLSSDKPLKSIVVTSSVPGEGKSEVSANLAAAIAQVGRRVLLIDADMRHPTQHHIWDLTHNSAGLSNIIVDQIDVTYGIQEVMENLDVLSSGVIPPNPVALLDSKRMAALVDTFSKDYDFIIFDTPPLAGTADAAVLGKLADGILLVVRPGVVDTASAAASKEFLEQSNQNVLGMVANGVRVKSEPDSYFYYSREQVETLTPGTERIALPMR